MNTLSCSTKTEVLQLSCPCLFYQVSAPSTRFTGFGFSFNQTLFENVRVFVNNLECFTLIKSHMRTIVCLYSSLTVIVCRFHGHDQRNDREFQRGMDTDERRRSRQTERLQLIKKQRQQRKSNKRMAFSRSNQQYVNDKNIPITSYHVRGIPIKIIDNVNDCETCVNQLLSNNPQLLGFDCEWKPMKNKQEYNRISLLQLCDNSICLLLKMIDIEKSGKFPTTEPAGKIEP